MKTIFHTLLGRSLAFSSLVGIATITSGCDGEEQAPAGVAGQAEKATPLVVATRVEAATVSPSSLAIQISRPGEIVPGRDASIAAALGGQIERVNIEVGDRVKAGQVVAKVDSSLHTAQASLAKVEVDDAKRELERLRSMGKTVAKVRIDDAETRLARAEAQLRISKIQAGKAVLKAPFAGTVAMRDMEKGEVAPPGMVLARIVSLDPALVSVSVADRDVAGLQVGLRANVTAVGASTPIEGKIKRIEPTANTKTRSFIVEVEVPNPRVLCDLA